MTLSESQAMEDFDFLGSEDNILLARFSRASFSDVPEGEKKRSIFIACVLGCSYSHKIPYSGKGFNLAIWRFCGKSPNLKPPSITVLCCAYTCTIGIGRYRIYM